MGIETADGKQNFKLASIFFFFWIKFSQRYIAEMIGVACNSQIPHAKWSKGWLITFCNSAKSYLSPFSKLP